VKLTKSYLDDLVKKFEVNGFIVNDPIQFPHRFDKQEDIEVSALISSCLAYGNRKKIIETLEDLHEILGDSPSDFVKSFDIKKNGNLFKGFTYRYTKEKDIALLISIIGKTLNDYGTLENAFLKGFNLSDESIKPSLTSFVNILRSYLPCDESQCSGLYQLLPSPELGSACKRLNLFLKWMVRKPPVDLNLWKNIPENLLIIPLDVHVARVSRSWKLATRKSNDWKTAEEITGNLRKYDNSDTVKYDFALFGMGINKENY